MNFSVTKNGEPLSKRKYKWDEKTRTFCTMEYGLVIDFSGIDYVTFKTAHNCTFKAGWDCTFDTGPDCTFDTGPCCTFQTGYECTFQTGYDCNFKTSYGCTFYTGKNCIFKTGHNCIFKTGENCFTARYDVKGVIEIPQGRTIKLNGHGTPGYTEVNPTHTIVIDGKEVKISDELYHTLKEA